MGWQTLSGWGPASITHRAQSAGSHRSEPGLHWALCSHSVLIDILFPQMLADPSQATEPLWSAASFSEAGVVTALICTGLLETSNVGTCTQT